MDNTSKNMKHSLKLGEIFSVKEVYIAKRDHVLICCRINNFDSPEVRYLKSKLIEVRFHGRGGQGAWTASLLLV